MSSGSENVVKAPKGIMHLALVICILLGIFVYAGWRIKNREKIETAKAPAAAQEQPAAAAAPGAPATVMSDLTVAASQLPGSPAAPSAASAVPALPAGAGQSAAAADSNSLLASLPGLPGAPAVSAPAAEAPVAGQSALSAVATTSSGATVPVAEGRMSSSNYKSFENKVATVSDKLKTDPVMAGRAVEPAKPAAKTAAAGVKTVPAEKAAKKISAVPSASGRAADAAVAAAKKPVAAKAKPVAAPAKPVAAKAAAPKVEQPAVPARKTVLVTEKPKVTAVSAVAKNTESAKDSKVAKDNKEGKDVKDVKDGKNAKGVSEGKDGGLYYVVVPGDSLSSIAEKFLGTRARAREVYEQNREQIGAPDQLRVGMRLHLPGAVKEDAPLVHVVRDSDSLPSLAVRYYGSSSPEVIGLLRKANPALQHGGFKDGMKLVVPARTIVNTAPGAAKGDGDTKVYYVKPGDSLRKIALALYHDESRWTEIYEANKKSIRNPENLYVGTKLELKD